MKTKTATQIQGGNPNGKRSAADFYPTPQDVTLSLLRFLDMPKGTTIWECACGEGDMVKAMQGSGYSVIATDLQQGVNFLTEPLRECDWIITNPPFNMADKFIERCAAHGKPFALLLKAQYWHAAKRYGLFQRIPPAAVCPLTWRPDFLFKSGKRGAPLMDVIWCIWNPQHKGGTLYYPLKKEG